MSRRLFVTTALPYANGPFHIGHIMEYIQADIWVRFQRMQGNDGAFHRRRRRARRADHARRGESRKVAGAIHRRNRRAAASNTSTAFISRSTTGTRRIRRKTPSCRRTSTASSIRAGLIYTKSIEQFFDPVKGMFLADRYIKGECPNCGAKDQYGDACENCSSVYSPTAAEEPVLDAFGREAGAEVLRALSSSSSPIPSAWRSCSEWIDAARPAATAGRQQGVGVARRRRRQGARRLGHLARPALLRHPRFPTSPRRNTSTSGSTRRSATSRA